jgi:hypothetical protein
MLKMNMRNAVPRGVTAASLGLVAMILLWSIPQPVHGQDVWVVGESAVVSTGGPDSDLYRVAGVVRLEDGRIVLGDQAQRLLVFDTDGSHLRTLGRRGEGPGEFTNIAWIQRLPGDTLLVFDARLGRLSYMTVDGGFARSETFGRRSTLYGALPDGNLLASTMYREPSGLGGTDRPRAPTNAVTFARGEIELQRFDTSGRLLNLIGVFPGMETAWVPGIMEIDLDGGPGPIARTLVLPGERGIYVTTGDRFEIMLFAPEGGVPEAVIRRDDYESQPLTREHLVQYFAGSGIGDWANWETLRWNLPEGGTLPAITSLRLDTQSNLWVEGGGDADDSRTWSVFTPAGEYFAGVTMPPRFYPYAIGTESVVGVWRDDLDVEYLQVRTIVKP